MRKNKTTFFPSLLTRILRYSWLLLLITLTNLACKKKNIDPVLNPEPEPEPVTALAIYKPREFGTMDYNNPESKWAYSRSKQSEHFIIFWDKKYGAVNPGSQDIPSQYRVDIDDMLKKAEEYYKLNIEVLKFAERGVGKSKLDNYKMMIFLLHQDEWLATGAGYDDTIGALWVSPGTSQPVGATIAHEIGHSFQYQVAADLGTSTGFRYGFGGNGGNGFWEQTAQWQAHQSYPDQNFNSHHFGVYTTNYHRHIHHEEYRYASYFIHHYWAQRHGKDIIGRIWKESKHPEDPVQAYMRLTGISNDQLNNEIYEAATKMATWDLDEIRQLGKNYIGRHAFKLNEQADGSFMVDYSICPGTTGYNLIPLKVPAAGTTISTTFTGLPNAPGFNQVNSNKAGWRYGYVALLANGTRVYGDTQQGTTKSVNFTIPASCTNLWFVVTGAPTTYAPHAWDDDNTNDEQWPYKVKFTNTTLINHIEIDANQPPKNIDFNIDVSFPMDNAAYTGKNVTIDIEALAKAFALQPAQITANTGNTIKFYAVEHNGTLNPNTTANGYGHWFNATGNVTGWGTTAKIFSEFNQNNFTFFVGQYPQQVNKNDVFTIRQALVYEYETGKKVQATFVFKIKIE